MAGAWHTKPATSQAQPCRRYSGKRFSRDMIYIIETPLGLSVVIKLRLEDIGVCITKQIRNAVTDKGNQEKTASLLSKMMDGENLSYTILGKEAIVRKLEAEFEYKTNIIAVESAFRRLGYEKGLSASFGGIRDNTPNVARQLAYIDSLSTAFRQTGDPVIYVDGRPRNWSGDVVHQEKEIKKSHGADACSYLRRKLKKLEPGQVYIPRAVQQKVAYVKVGTGNHRNPGILMEAIAAWCDVIGRCAFPSAKRMLVVCASSRYQGERKGLWEYHLFQLAMSKDVEIYFSFMPFGRYRWRWKQEVHRLCQIDARKGEDIVVTTVISTVVPFGGGTRSLGRKCSTFSDICWLYKITSDIFDTVDIRRPRFCKHLNFSVHGFKKEVMAAISQAEKEEKKEDASPKHETARILKDTAKQLGVQDNLEIVFREDRKKSLQIIQQAIKLLSASIGRSLRFIFQILEGEDERKGEKDNTANTLRAGERR